MAMYLGTDRVLGAYLGSDIYDGMALGSDESTSNYGILKYYDDDPASNSGDWTVVSGFGGGVGTNANGITLSQTSAVSCSADISFTTVVGRKYEVIIEHDSTSAGSLFLLIEDGDGNTVLQDLSWTAGKTTTQEYTATDTTCIVTPFGFSVPIGTYVVSKVYFREMS